MIAQFQRPSPRPPPLAKTTKLHPHASPAYTSRNRTCSIYYCEQLHEVPPALSYDFGCRLMPIDFVRLSDADLLQIATVAEPKCMNPC
jgi:hypothetical protein